MSAVHFVRQALPDLNDIDKYLVEAFAIVDRLPPDADTQNLRHFLQLARLDLKVARMKLTWACE